ncbi:MAG: hypothetical protein RLY31_601 [Bacteroidota bacterium]|jgi:HAD superfamily hydrolase (TIGR01509 family)
MKAVIFDLDGTMVDNMMVHHRAWQSTLARLGLDWDLPRVQREIHGINEEILERIFGDRFAPAERQALSAEKEAEYRRIFQPELQTLAGLPHLLDALRQADIPVAIGTAAPVENVDFVLDGLQLRPFFRSVFHAGHVRRGKPDPEIFRLAADSFGVSPADCLVFEDSPTGVATAANFGSRAVVLTTTHPPEEFRQLSHVAACIPDYTGLTLSQLREWCRYP